MQETSLMAYYEICSNGTVGKQQARILRFFVNNYSVDYTNSEVSVYTGVKTSSVCGRMKELRNDGYLVFSQRRLCKQTRFMANAYRLNRNCKRLKQ